jgi:hypothetical protein
MERPKVRTRKFGVREKGPDVNRPALRRATNCLDGEGGQDRNFSLQRFLFDGVRCDFRSLADKKPRNFYRNNMKCTNVWLGTHTGTGDACGSSDAYQAFRHG